MTVTTQDCVWSLEELGKLNETGDVETQDAGRLFEPVPVTTWEAVKGSLFLGSVTLCVKEPLPSGERVKDWLAGEYEKFPASVNVVCAWIPETLPTAVK